MRNSYYSDLHIGHANEYEVPLRRQFFLMKKPTVTIKDRQLYFNMASIHSFEGVQYIIPIFNKKKHRLVVIPCREEEAGSIEWARKKADGTWTNKIIRNQGLVSKISSFMRWDLRFRYKLLGEVRMSKHGPILVFECDEAMIFYKPNVELLTHNKS